MMKEGDAQFDIAMLIDIEDLESGAKIHPLLTRSVLRFDADDEGDEE